MSPRPMAVLLQVVYAGEDDPLMPQDHRIVSAFEERRITREEARLLQSFSALKPATQKRKLTASVPVGEAAVEEMRAKLAAASEKLRNMQ